MSRENRDPNSETKYFLSEKEREMKKILTCLLVLGLILNSSLAYAEWPEQPIKLVVSFSPGGGTDITARTLAPLLEKELGGEIVVINRPGAAGETGHRFVAKAKTDGYTMGILNIPPAITIPITRDADFTLDDFMPVANLIEDPSALSVAVDSPFKTLNDLVAYARENPAAVTVATNGVGTDDHFAVIYLERAAGIDLTPVPFPGSGPSRTALLGGHVTAAAINLGGMMPYHKKVNILAHFGKKRTELAVRIPTAAESGWNAFMNSERGLVFPAGVPAEIVEKTAAAVEKVVNSATWKESLKEQYTEYNYMGPAEFAKHLDELDKNYRQLWKENPWK